MPFPDRVGRLPRLGLGVSTEYGAGDAPTTLDVLALRDAHPHFAGFLEIGVETAKGLDRRGRWGRRRGRSALTKASTPGGSGVRRSSAEERSGDPGAVPTDRAPKRLGARS